MPLNLNIVVNDKTAETFKTVKEQGRFRTNTDVITFALFVAAKSEDLRKLKESFNKGWQEAVKPSEPATTQELREQLGQIDERLNKLRQMVERLEAEK